MAQPPRLCGGCPSPYHEPSGSRSGWGTVRLPSAAPETPVPTDRSSAECSVRAPYRTVAANGPPADPSPKRERGAFLWHSRPGCVPNGEPTGHSCVPYIRPAPLFRTVDPPWRVAIVNEAQCMTAKAVQAWLTLLDPLPAHVIVVFTTTEDSADLFGQYDGPFRSRCKTVAFTNQGLAERFAERAREIAQAEGLDGKPATQYVRLVQRCRNNMRAVLQAIEAGEMLE